MAKPDPNKDAAAIRKLNVTKKANSVERTDNRLRGKDGKHTRDGGTTRRNWKPRND